MRKKRKKKIKFFVLGAMIVIVFLFFISLYSEKEEPTLYWCGLSKFGGSSEVTDPDACKDQQEKLEVYGPICEKMVRGYDASWEDACLNVLRNPVDVCLTNMENLGIELSKEEEDECFKELELAAELIWGGEYSVTTSEDEIFLCDSDEDCRLIGFCDLEAVNKDHVEKWYETNPAPNYTIEGGGRVHCWNYLNPCQYPIAICKKEKCTSVPVEDVWMWRIPKDKEEERYQKEQCKS